MKQFFFIIILVMEAMSMTIIFEQIFCLYSYNYEAERRGSLF